MAELLTVTRPTWAVPAIAAKVAELNDRIAAKGLGEPVSFDVSEVRYPPFDPYADDPGPTVDIQARTCGAGRGRINSDRTLVSMTIMQ